MRDIYTSVVGRRLRNIALLLVMPLVASAACQGAPSNDAGPAAEPSGDLRSGGEPRLGVIRQIRKADELVLPLDAYHPTDRQLHAIGHARHRLQAACMKRFGFSLSRAPATADAALDRPLHAGTFGVVSLDEAREYGYRQPWFDDASKVDPSPRQMSGAEETVLFGRGQSSYGGKPIPERGCVGEADRKLAKGATVPTDPGFYSIVQMRSLDAAQGDSRGVAATTKWSACMKKKGYDYRDPAAANNDPVLARSRKVASAREKSIAVADVECKQRTNYIGILYALMTAYEKRAIEQNSEELNKVRAYYLAQLRNSGQPGRLGGA